MRDEYPCTVSHTSCGQQTVALRDMAMLKACIGVLYENQSNELTIFLDYILTKYFRERSVNEC